MTSVIKRNKRRQKYSMAKLERAIQKAAREGKVKAAKGKQVAREIATGITKAVKRRRSVKATELRRRVLRRLESRSRAAVVAWRRFDRRRRG